MNSHPELDVLLLLVRTHAFATAHDWESFYYDSDWKVTGSVLELPRGGEEPAPDSGGRVCWLSETNRSDLIYSVCGLHGVHIPTAAGFRLPV